MILRKNKIIKANMSGSVGILRATLKELSDKLTAKGVENTIKKIIMSILVIITYPRTQAKGTSRNQFCSFTIKRTVSSMKKALSQ